MLLSCSGLKSRRMSMCASGSCERKRSMPSCAMRSAIRILISSATLPCSSSIVPGSSLLRFKTKREQAYLHRIHGLNQVHFLEEAEMSHAEYLALQVLLSAAKDNVILFTQCVQQRPGIDAIGCEHSRNGVRCVFMIGEQAQSHFFGSPAHVIAHAL